MQFKCNTSNFVLLHHFVVGLVDPSFDAGPRGVSGDSHYVISSHVRLPKQMEYDTQAEAFASQCLDLRALTHGTDLETDTNYGEKKRTKDELPSDETEHGDPTPKPPPEQRPESHNLQAESTSINVKEGCEKETGQPGKKNAAKRERNKKAAFDYRKRRKAYVEGLEGKIKTIKTEMYPFQYIVRNSDVQEQIQEAKAREIESLKANNQFLYHQNISLLQQVDSNLSLTL